MSTFDMNNATEEALKMDVYAIYLRKSRADEKAEKLGEEETLARHKKILTELAVRKGFYIGKIYQEVVSGETIEARPEIQKLIADCYAGKYKGILIVEVSRLSRGNQGDAQKIMDCLKYSNRNDGVLVITPTKTYDVAHNQDDEEYMEFELFMSRREFKMINKRMERGRKQAIVEGNFMGSSRPYGYDIVKTRTSRTLVPNEAEAPIVKKIFEWSVKENLSPFKIAERLTAMGVPTYHDAGEWSKGTIKYILLNETYTGKVRWNNRMQVKTMVNGAIKTTHPRHNDSEHFMLYDGKHMKHALIDQETFKAATAKYRRDRTRGDLKLSNPLAGLLLCKSCGKTLSYNAYRQRPNNVMPRFYHKQSAICNVKSVMAQDVMNALIHCLKLYIEDFEFKIDNTPDVDETSVTTEIENLYKEIRKIEKVLDKIYVAWENDNLTDNEFVKRKNINNSKIESLKDQIERLECTIPEREECEEKILKLSEALSVLLDDNMDADIKNEVLKQIIDKIEYSRENKEEFILDIDLR